MHAKHLTLGTLGLGTLLMLAACGGGGGKKVYFGNLADGASVDFRRRIPHPQSETAKRRQSG